MQVQEEMYHAIKMYNFILERNGRPYFTKVPEPQKKWDSIKAVFENALEHEKLVTERINKIMTVAISENDHATSSFFNWFVDEQVEEESSVDSVIKKLNLIKDSSEGLFMLDKDMAVRVFTPPPDLVL
jgi:ferritin